MWLWTLLHKLTETNLYSVLNYSFINVQNACSSDEQMCFTSTSFSCSGKEKRRDLHWTNHLLFMSVKHQLRCDQVQFILFSYFRNNFTFWIFYHWTEWCLKSHVSFEQCSYLHAAGILGERMVTADKCHFVSLFKAKAGI